MNSTYYSGTYITKNLDRLNASSLEDLVAQRIWKTKKGNNYKYQHFDHMSEEHLHNAINSFLKTNNHIVLDALYNELKHRKNKADEIKQKIKNTMNSNNNTHTEQPVQTEFGFDQSNTATEAAKVAETLNKTDTNYLPQEFFKNQVIKGYTVVDVESTNNRGYVLIVRKEGEENTMRISQSKFREKVGLRVYNKNKDAKKQKAPKAKAVKQVVQKNNVKKIIEQKYQIGDVVGSYQILDVMRSNKGITGGFRYLVKDKYGKKKPFWIKQSALCGNVVNVIKKQPATIDDYSGEAVKQPAANIQPVDIKAEIKKMSFFDKIKALFS